MKKIDKVYKMLEELEVKMKRGISAFEISEVLHIDRTSVSMERHFVPIASRIGARFG
ncbi:MAG: hypothetical protein K0R93_2494 [Anaerosolibacter sp.]|jgi:hypothetical protein|uniref:hypothetical protein n=1 Tax=Anaerosolibacter sp. TaxID=1872527 RepID=UPI00260A0BE3|nr:hypothetical protein [Anaerosolibacter sp.]MDF2547596.1 hypothetical protein [Anaerosolibacter sp.]